MRGYDVVLYWPGGWCVCGTDRVDCPRNLAKSVTVEWRVQVLLTYMCGSSSLSNSIHRSTTWLYCLDFIKLIWLCMFVSSQMQCSLIPIPSAYFRVSISTYFTI
jgi:hypothetical protein